MSNEDFEERLKTNAAEAERKRGIRNRAADDRRGDEESRRHALMDQCIRLCDAALRPQWVSFAAAIGVSADLRPSSDPETPSVSVELPISSVAGVAVTASGAGPGCIPSADDGESCIQVSICVTDEAQSTYHQMENFPAATTPDETIATWLATQLGEKVEHCIRIRV
jgi:hypothetical protein